MSTRPLVAVLVASFVGCASSSTPPDGSSTTASTTSAPASATGTTKASAAASVESPRVAKAKQIARFLDEPDMANEPEQAARIAAMGFTEADFGLPKGQLKALKALASGGLDPSQCATIIGSTLEETAKPAIEKRCGSLDALKASIGKSPAASKSADLMKACKITRADVKDPSKLNPWAVLMSTIVGDELEADPATDGDEAKAGRALVGLCPIGK